MTEAVENGELDIDDAREQLQRFVASAGDTAHDRACVDATLGHLEQFGPAAFARSTAGHLTASAVVLDPHGRVLLCFHPKYGRWLQLGGHIDAGDRTLDEAAAREAREESGLGGLVQLGGIVDIDVHVVPCPKPGSAHYDVRYVLVASGDLTVHCSEESLALAWHVTLPDDCDAATRRAVARARARLDHTA